MQSLLRTQRRRDAETQRRGLNTSGTNEGQWASQITQLTAIGFEAAVARTVVEATNGNVDQVIAIVDQACEASADS